MKSGFCPGEFDWGNKLLLRVCCILSSRWAAESKLRDNFRGPCFLLYFKSCLILALFYCYFFLLSFYLNVSLNIYHVFCFYHITGFLSLGTSGSLVFGASFWTLFILFSFLSFWFVLCNSDFLILSHYVFYLFILFYYY